MAASTTFNLAEQVGATRLAVATMIAFGASIACAQEAAKAPLASPHLVAWPDAALSAQLDEVAPAAKIDSTKVGHYGYGEKATEQQISGWAIEVRPDGVGLPIGSGTVSHGADVYAQYCAACHGTFGESVDNFPKLAADTPLTGDQPSKAIGNYWPYATTLFDYVNRAMPYPAPRILSNDDVYAITAYILNLNDVVPEDFVASAQTLAEVKMPNRNGFSVIDPRPDTTDAECMKNCLTPEAVKITSTAEGRDLTPKSTGPLDEMTPQ